MKLKFKQSRNPIKLNFFTPIKMSTSKSVTKIPLKNLTWPQASIRFPKLNPFGDKDRDGKLNMFDCKPFDSRRHGRSHLFKEEVARRLLDKQNFINKNKSVYSGASKFDKRQQEYNDETIRQFIKSSVTNTKRNKSREQLTPDLRTHEGKSMMEGTIKQYWKHVGYKDIINYASKHPEILQDLENIKRVGTMEREYISTKPNDITRGQYERNANTITISPVMKRKWSVGEILEHEMRHAQQAEDEKVLGLKYHTIPNDKEYATDKYELDASEEPVRRKKERIDWKKEQPETLQQLDNNDNQIPDTTEEVDIKPIEINEKEENED
jgi:hypothetical protein